MDFLKDSFSIILISCSFILIGCSNPNLKRIEATTGINLNKYLSKIDELEQWNDFNGDGFKVISYRNDKEVIVKLVKSVKSRKFNDFDKNNVKYLEILSDSELSFCDDNCNGFYITKWGDNEITTIIIDTTNKKLIYSLTLM